MRFRGPPARVRLDVPRCLPGFDAHIFPLTRRLRQRRGLLGLGGEDFPRQPFERADVDVR